MKQITINLTKEEAEVLDDYIERKCYKLEQSGLTNSKCYPLLYSVHRKIVRTKKKNRVSISDNIYIVYHDSISKHKVTMLSNDAFCHNDSFNSNYVDDYPRILTNTQEGVEWFRTLNEAKRKVRETYGNCKFEKWPDEDYWEARLE